MHIGFGNVVPWPRVAAILAPGSHPMKRLRDEAHREHRLIDARFGRKCRGIIITDSNHVVLSANSPDVLKERLVEARREDEGQERCPNQSRPRGRLGGPGRGKGP